MYDVHFLHREETSLEQLTPHPPQAIDLSFYSIDIPSQHSKSPGYLERSRDEETSTEALEPED